MKEYPKINTVYARNPDDHKIMVGVYSQPEFEYLSRCKWQFSEKIDGTNIRIAPRFPIEGSPELVIGGRTSAAQIPAQLYANIQALIPFAKFQQCFEGQDLVPITLYGEGYGAGIQKGGGNYGLEQSFVLFDVLYGDNWLERSNVEDIARKLGIRAVPIIGEGTLTTGIRLGELGYCSLMGGPKTFAAEGIVARPVTELRDRRGRRIITKIKHKDFEALNIEGKKSNAKASA